MPGIFNLKSNRDSAWVTADLAIAGEEPSADNPVPMQMRSSDQFGILAVDLVDDDDTVLDADQECVEFVMQNETGSDVWWSVAGDAGAIAADRYNVLHTGDVAAVPFENLNMVQARMEALAGPGTIKVTWRN